MLSCRHLKISLQRVGSRLRLLVQHPVHRSQTVSGLPSDPPDPSFRRIGSAHSRGASIVGGQVSWSAVSEEPALAVVAANNPGVPCASTPAADEGTTLTPGHLLEGGNVGDWSGSADFTPPTPGAYILCGWLEEPAGLIETDGGPVTASTTLQVQVRPPVISLKLSLPRPFMLNLTATGEVQRHVVVEGVTAPRHGCPINYAVEKTTST